MLVETMEVQGHSSPVLRSSKQTVQFDGVFTVARNVGMAGNGTVGGNHGGTGTSISMVEVIQANGEL